MMSSTRTVLTLAATLWVSGCGQFSALHVSPAVGTVIAEDGRRKEATLQAVGPARVAVGAAEASADALLEDESTAVVRLLAAASPERGESAMASASTWADGEITAVRFIVPSEHGGSRYRVEVPLEVVADERKGVGAVKVERRFVIVDRQGRDAPDQGAPYGRGGGLEESFETAPLPAGVYAIRLEAGARAEAPTRGSRARIELNVRVRVARLE